jgi:hypothetical protein
MDALEYIEPIVSNVWCSFDLWQHMGPQSLARFVIVEDGKLVTKINNGYIPTNNIIMLGLLQHVTFITWHKTKQNMMILGPLYTRA